MIGKTISHYKILEKLGEGGSPREIKQAGLSIDFCLHILGILENLNGSIISRGKWVWSPPREINDSKFVKQAKNKYNELFWKLVKMNYLTG